MVIWHILVFLPAILLLGKHKTQFEQITHCTIISTYILVLNFYSFIWYTYMSKSHEYIESSYLTAIIKTTRHIKNITPVTLPAIGATEMNIFFLHNKFYYRLTLTYWYIIFRFFKQVLFFTPNLHLHKSLRKEIQIQFLKVFESILILNFTFLVIMYKYMYL